MWITSICLVNFSSFFIAPLIELLFIIVSHIFNIVIELTSLAMAETIFLYYVFLKNGVNHSWFMMHLFYKLYTLHICINLYVYT